MKFKLFIESKSDFDYSEISKEKWYQILKLAKEESGISFDNENDSDVCQRDIIVDQDFWEHTKCKFRCELRMAGGDWQSPVVYFRCQLLKGYADVPEKHRCAMFCFIPGKHQGNGHLSKTKTGWTAPDYDKDDEEPNQKLCWTALKSHLRSLVEREIDNVKKHNHES